MTKLNQTENEVLKAIIGGTRVFAQSKEVKAVGDLASRGYISFEILEGRQTVSRSYNFGRTIVSKIIPDVAVRVSASKIEAAIEKHGVATVLNSIR
jgi:hypothetical protein